jgi:hypothetical protein
MCLIMIEDDILDIRGTLAMTPFTMETTQLPITGGLALQECQTGKHLASSAAAALLTNAQRSLTIGSRLLGDKA